MPKVKPIVAKTPEELASNLGLPAPPRRNGRFSISC
jgi:hypothetical protein